MPRPRIPEEQPGDDSGDPFRPPPRDDADWLRQYIPIPDDSSIRKGGFEIQNRTGFPPDPPEPPDDNDSPLK